MQEEGSLSSGVLLAGINSPEAGVLHADMLLVSRQQCLCSTAQTTPRAYHHVVG